MFEVITRWLARFVHQNFYTLIIFFIVLILTRFLTQLKPHRSPPGPWGLPILGYMPFLGQQVHYTLFDLSRKFGNCFQFSIGCRKMVVLADPALIRKAFTKEEFAGRPSTKLFDMFQGYGKLILPFVYLSKNNINNINDFEYVF